MKVRVGDGILNFCVAMYVSHLAWPYHPHYVQAVWLAACALNLAETLLPWFLRNRK